MKAALQYMLSDERRIARQIQHIKPGDVAKLLTRIDQLSQEIAKVAAQIEAPRERRSLTLPCGTVLEFNKNYAT
jgi:hypothetical protein